jgi:hypothetical protein
MATIREFSSDPGMPLLWFIRDELNLTGTKFGCGVGVCGACNRRCTVRAAHRHLQLPIYGRISVGPELLKQVIAREATVGSSR